MKKIISILLIIVATATTFAQKEMDQFQIQVDGLGCPFCAYGLEKKFKEFKGIKNIEIAIETGDFKFEYPAEKQLTMNAVVDQVKKAGYTPKTAVITRNNGEVEELNVPEKKTTSVENSVTETFKVAGNCEMCKARIEAAALKLDGVEKANWNVETKIMEINFDKDKISVKKVEENIAKVGHETKNVKADQSAYDQLPACCIYKK